MQIHETNFLSDFFTRDQTNGLMTSHDFFRRFTYVII